MIEKNLARIGLVLALGIAGCLAWGAPATGRTSFAQPPRSFVALPPPADAWRFHPVDLGPYYNFALTNSILGRGPLNGANNLASFPPGYHAFDQILFRVEGIVQLAGRQSMMARKDFPKRVESIRVDRQFKLLHLLHGAGWEDEEGKPIAKVVIHYADGRWRDIPIVYGQQVRDWWDNDEEALKDPNTRVAWTGTNPVAKSAATWLTVYRTSFPNPRPEARVESLEFASAWNESAWFVLGVTGE